jgi:NAD(P)H-nitrite reductase large subunit
MSDKKTIICRCEDLTRKDIQRVIKDGFVNVEEIKRLTRCGMGPCQGRTCHQLVVREISALTGIPVDQIEPAYVRPPTKPVRLGVLKGEGHHE